MVTIERKIIISIVLTLIINSLLICLIVLTAKSSSTSNSEVLKELKSVENNEKLMFSNIEQIENKYIKNKNLDKYLKYNDIFDNENNKFNKK
ncbi:ORF MSV114 hypothetical protein [Melanoplus sanguinipes entomopoxvirus]|uniref:Uncharacterized protein n=1 Tax=Melanoplus sanguinipes entomopoxvirus TaxID=83191 RepID=Q9YVX8_MSEPV|nr:ORF MSV114 hypothetical protein [Melanoplus sanguinipes entomopoxvirus]AAC97803.1 ORF MSV114 hypothetical protein [Melanoplus sanguinipes entomopoxvirus 'O']